MTLADLYGLLNDENAFKDKVTYRAWPEGEAPSLPFVCYYVESSDNILADNKVYQTRQDVVIELYTVNKDPDSEELLESVLDANDIPWEKFEEYIDTENCYQISYEITI